jgi:hypothetical protein
VEELSGLATTSTDVDELIGPDTRFTETTDEDALVF